MDPSKRETKDEALGAVSVGVSVLILVFSCVYMYVCFVIYLYVNWRDILILTTSQARGPGAVAASPLSAQPNSEPW